ncbi:hypothetical protein L6270_00835 [Candidatus Parcubacteria bacterium]|nr:hypothetical protein [Patescibacteria group bacterium]MBU4309694.1 hypothetical protein [Patescibacteria group bacterium]MBU4431682.1 hypothetical protein [Patescibacteria group bacterium]MBU4577918.1 hypothetical protein [Patescibacteria group bacterium]MCG2696572.1 hypothetical protein [Candidatus Parcubacteria bacterium]
MKNLYLVRVLQSNYCKLVFLLAFFGSYYLVPANIFIGKYRLLVLVFMLIFSTVAMCVVRNIKEKVIVAHQLKTSFVGLLLYILGLSALQVCGMSATMCTASIGAGLVSIIFPGAVFNYLVEYSVYVIYFSIITQLFVLHHLKCFFSNNK